MRSAAAIPSDSHLQASMEWENRCTIISTASLVVSKYLRTRHTVELECGCKLIPPSSFTLASFSGLVGGDKMFSLLLHGQGTRLPSPLLLLTANELSQNWKQHNRHCQRPWSPVKCESRISQLTLDSRTTHSLHSHEAVYDVDEQRNV